MICFLYSKLNIFLNENDIPFVLSRNPEIVERYCDNHASVSFLWIFISYLLGIRSEMQSQK